MRSCQIASVPLLLALASPAAAQVEIEIPPVVASPDRTARVDVVLRSNGATVGGMQNDLVFDNSVLKIDPQFGCRINEAISDRLPECTDSDAPTLPCKTLSRHLGPCDTVGPLGSCPAPDPALSRFRAIIFGILNSNTIPDGSVLYTCVLDVVNAHLLPALIVNTSVVASDPSGERLLASGRNGAVLGSAEQAPPPTWTRRLPTSTSTPTATRTPTSTAAPGTPTPSPTRTLVPTRTISPTPLPPVVIRITSAEPSADGTVTVDIVLDSAGDLVSRTQNDILFHRNALRLAGASSCQINPEISDEQPNCNLDRQSLVLPCKTLIRDLAPCSRDPLPDGCPQDAPGLDRLRARVASVTTGEETIIPGGSVLYRCTFTVVAPDGLPTLLKVANAVAVSRFGIDPPTLGADGSVFAAGRPTPAPTWTVRSPPPTSTPSPSLTPPPNRVPTATPTPPPPIAATRTPTFVATLASVRIRSAALDARGEATVEVLLEANGEVVGRVRHDILFDTRAVRLESASACEINPLLGDRNPACAPSAGDVRQPCKTFRGDLASCAVRPVPDGCRENDLNSGRFRAIIDATARPNTVPIPDGSVLYTCRFKVADGGRLPTLLLSSNVALASPTGRGIDAEGTAGEIVSRDGSAPTSTPSATPSPQASLTAGSTRPRENDLAGSDNEGDGNGGCALSRPEVKSSRWMLFALPCLVLLRATHRRKGGRERLREPCRRRRMATS